MVIQNKKQNLDVEKLQDKDLKIQELKNQLELYENQIRVLNERVNLFFDNSPDMMYEIDFRGPKFLWVNNSLCERLGFSRDELLAENPLDLLDNESKKIFQERINQSLSGEKQPEWIEYTGYTKDGQIVIGELNITFTYENGKPVGGTVIVHDITERKKTEALYKSILDNSIDALYRRDLIKGRYDYFGSAIELISGFSVEEVLNMGPEGILERVHPDDISKVLAEKMDLKSSITQGTVEYRFLCKNGAYKWISDNFKIIRDENGVQIIREGNVRDINDLNKAERELKQNEARFRAVLNNSPDVVYRFNLQSGEYEYMSPAIRKLGFRPEELMSMSNEEVLSRVHPEDRPALISLLSEINDVGEGSCLYRFKDNEGKYHWWSNKLVIIKDSENQPLYRDGFVRDITELKKAEEALKEEKDKLSGLLNSIPDEIWFADVNKNLELVNSAVFNVDDLEKEEVVEIAGKFEVYRSDGTPRPEEEAPHLRALKGEIVKNQVEIVRIPATGELRHRQVNSTPVKDINGNITGSVTVVRDVTDVKKIEEEIIRNIKLIEGVNKVFKESLNCDTEEEVVSECLKVAEELTGSEFSFIGEVNSNGRLDDRAISPPGWEACTANPKRSLESLRNMEIVSYWGRTIKEEKSQIVNDPESDPDKRGLPEGHPPINSFMGVPLKQGNKTIGMIALANKIGGYNEKDKENIETLSYAFVEALMRKKAEINTRELLENEQNLSEELRISNEELISYQDDLNKVILKLEVSNRELEQFAYVASHDLQEPLRMVASFSQLLEKRYKDRLDEDADEFIKFIVEGANRMKVLIDDLLAFSRLNTEGKPFELVNMGKSVEEVFLYLEKSIEESKAEINRDPLPTIIGDSSQIRQLLQNLLSNAIKFHDEEPPKIYISSQELENVWKIGVSDEGIGVDLEHQEKIFEVFKRLHTREEYPGTGIGLAICKRIVERHDGKIWIESEPGKGTTFYFTIPKT